MRVWAIFTFAVLFSSCSVFTNKPSDLINDDELVDILVDVHFTDALISIKGYRIIQDSLTINLFYDDVMKKHNISRAQLDRTIKYYSQNVEKYDRIYDQVLEILSKQQKQFNESLKTPTENTDTK